MGGWVRTPPRSQRTSVPGSSASPGRHQVLRAEGELHRLLRETHPPGGRLHPLLPGLLPAYDLPPVWPGRPTVEVLVRSYWMEEGTLRGFLLPSLATFWPWPQHRAVIVLDFESDKGVSV